MRVIGPHWPEAQQVDMLGDATNLTARAEGDHPTHYPRADTASTMQSLAEAEPLFENRQNAARREIAQQLGVCSPY